MKPSPLCYDLIKSFEGLVLHAYPDPGSGNEPWTIGYGTTIYPDGNKVKKGDTATKEQAEAWLRFDVDRFAAKVYACTGDLQPRQFDALVSFAYNVGIGNLEKSTLLRKVKANPNDPSIAAEFLKWNKAAGKVMAGLTKRRAKEAEVYFS